MDTYSKIVKFSILLILLFIFATNSYALCPNTLVRTVLLLLGSISLIFSAYTYNREKAYFKTGIFACLCALPWAFYLQQKLIFGEFVSDLATAPQTFPHIMVVFNLFRYLLLAFAFFILVKGLFLSIKIFMKHKVKNYFAKNCIICQ